MNTSQPLRANPPSCLNMLRFPARLNAEQTAQILGFQPHHIPILIKAGLLDPLGGGPRNSVKFFAAVEIRALGRDRDWLDRATEAISRREGRPTSADHLDSGEPDGAGRPMLREGGHP